jgi:hypothetical protein
VRGRPQAGHWDHAEHQDQARFKRDVAQCVYEGAAATSSAPSTFSLGQNVAQDIATGVRRGEFERLGMQARGYFWVAR